MDYTLSTLPPVATPDTPLSSQCFAVSDGSPQNNPDTVRETPKSSLRASLPLPAPPCLPDQEHLWAAVAAAYHRCRRLMQDADVWTDQEKRQALRLARTEYQEALMRCFDALEESAQ